VPRLIVVEHPVLADRIATLRDRSTTHGPFRRALHEAASILAIEATRDLPTVERVVETPLEATTGRRLEADIAVVPVLRAGLGMVEGFLALFAEARVGHLGMQRDETELTPRDYFERLPPGLADAYVFILDPMLATGGSAVAAIQLLRDAGAAHIRIVCIVAAPEGIRTVEDHYPEVSIYTPVVDHRLNEHKYIVPGLGDFGDRLYGTI
jgi:uracil phosphoribosyltransferase